MATRKHLIFSYGEALVNEFIKQHIDQITLFRSLIVNGIEYDPITEKDGKDVFNEMLIKKIYLVLIIHCLMNLNCQRLIYNKIGNLKPQLKNMLIALNLKQIKGLNVY